MTVLILSVAAVIIVALVVFYLKTKKPVETTQVLQVEKEPKPLTKLLDGEVLLVKSGESWIVSDQMSYDPDLTKGKVVKLSPISGSVTFDAMCSEGAYLRSVVSNYSVRFDIKSLNIETILMTKDDLKSLISLNISSLFRTEFSELSVRSINDSIGSINSEVQDSLKKKLYELGLIADSLSIDIMTSNMSLIKSLYEEKKELMSVDELEEAEKGFEREIKLAEINKSKIQKLNEIAIESAEIESKKDLELNKIQMAKYAQINAKKSEDSFISQKRDKENELKLAQQESERNIKMTEIKAAEMARKFELDKESKLKSIEANREAELAKLNSDNEIAKLEATSEIELSNLKKDAELNDLKNKVSLEKEKFDQEAKLHEDKLKSEERDLELSVTLPAKKEAEKNEILAKNKALVKDIDTESTIKTSKAKIEFKKEEESIKSEIKKQQDLNDLEVYEKMMVIADNNPELAIQWKMIEKSVEIAKIQGDSLSKLNLGQITINGSGVNEGSVGNILGNLIPMLTSTMNPQAPQLIKKSVKSTKSTEE